MCDHYFCGVPKSIYTEYVCILLRKSLQLGDMDFCYVSMIIMALSKVYNSNWFNNFFLKSPSNAYTAKFHIRFVIWLS